MRFDPPRSLPEPDEAPDFTRMILGRVSLQTGLKTERGLLPGPQERGHHRLWPIVSGNPVILVNGMRHNGMRPRIERSIGLVYSDRNGVERAADPVPSPSVIPC